MNLRELLDQLNANGWHRGPDDVEIMVSDGPDADAYTLDAVYDQGNHIILVGDRA